MTDSHMVGGHQSGPAGVRLLQQVSFIVATLVGVAGLYVLGAFLWSEEQRLRVIAWTVIGAIGVLVIGLHMRRRRGRQSLDDVLRSRRHV